MTQNIQCFRVNRVPKGDSVEWAVRHGMDPKIIPYDSEIIIDFDRRRIIYMVFDLDENGDVIWEVQQGRVYPQPVLREVTLQLESPPKPFPLREAIVGDLT